jgi:hypothetical protein
MDTITSVEEVNGRIHIRVSDGSLIEFGTDEVERVVQEKPLMLGATIVTLCNDESSKHFYMEYQPVGYPRLRDLEFYYQP